MPSPELEAVLVALEAEVARDGDVTSSVVTVITRLLADVEANKLDPARIQAIVDTYRAHTDATAAAVASVPGQSQPPAPPVEGQPSSRRRG